MEEGSFRALTRLSWARACDFHRSDERAIAPLVAVRPHRARGPREAAQEHGVEGSFAVAEALHRRGQRFAGLRDRLPRRPVRTT